MATAVIGIAGDLLGGLFGAHAARAQGATNENSAVNELVKGYDQAMRTIFDQANSGQMTANDAINAVESLMPQYWQALARFQTAPGTHAVPCHGVPAGDPPNQFGDSTPCDKKCTAGCCVGCNPLASGVANAVYVFSHGGGKAVIPKVYGSKYGGQERATYYLTYTPPPLRSPVGEFGNVLNELTSSLTGDHTITGSGIPFTGSSKQVMIYVIGFALLLIIIMLVRR